MIQRMTCPICNKPISAEVVLEDKFLPFCSERCQQVDFFRWSDGRYAIEEPLDQRPDLFEKLVDDEQFDV